jgi:hypothetical protein
MFENSSSFWPFFSVLFFSEDTRCAIELHMYSIFMAFWQQRVVSSLKDVFAIL